MRKMVFTVSEAPAERTTYLVQGIGPDGEALSEELEEPAPGEQLITKHKYRVANITLPDKYLRAASGGATVSVRHGDGVCSSASRRSRR